MQIRRLTQILAIVILALQACGKDGAKEATAEAPKAPPPADDIVVVKIGVAGPLTGGIAHLGKDDENGVRLAIDEANAKKLRIGGKVARFEVLSEDDQADPKLGMTIAQKFVNSGVAGVVGHLNSGVTLPASAIYNAAGIPMISGSATNPRLTEQGFKNVFRTSSRDDLQGVAVANYMAKDLKVRRVAIVDDNTAYGEGLANEVEKTLKAAGVEVIAREKTSDKATDFRELLNKIKVQKPDAVFYGGMDATAGPMLKQARASGIKAQFAFGDGACTIEMSKLAGTSIAEGMICSQAGIPTQAVSNAFKEAFTKKYGAVKQYAPFYYDSANLLIAAMQQADSTDPSVYLAALNKISYQGATGRVEFDAKGDRKNAETTIFQMKAGSVEPIAIVSTDKTINVEPPIVYNADISPQLPRDPATPTLPVLRAREPVTLRFAIGPRWRDSLLPDVAPSSEILNSKDNLPLTVVLSCDFCEPRAESRLRMTYMPDLRRSDEVSFRFTPRRRPDGKMYRGKLNLGIYNNKTGREYDRMLIDVAIAGTPSVSISDGRNIASLSAPSKPLADNGWEADVILHVDAANGSTVTMQVEPLSEQLKAKLGPLALSEKGLRTFRTGIVNDKKLVDAMTNTTYGVVSAMSEQGTLLKRLSADGVDVAVSKKSQESLELTPDESERVSSVIAQLGKSLYLRLFAPPKADADLGKLIGQLEDAGAAAPSDRPLRVIINTDNISIPWQYLHPVGPDVDARKFWGLLFSLSVYRNSTYAQGRGENANTQQARKVVFARFGSSGDPSVPLAKQQEQQIRLLPVAEGDFVGVDNGPDLMNKLRERRKEISAIVAFLHARFAAGEPDPQLMFNEGDVVSSRRLESLLTNVPMKEQDGHYLAGAPLVILNGCETGPSVNLPHVSLEDVMFQLGAQGVVVTEASVWIPLGHNVGTLLIERLGKGETIADALTKVRRALYEKKSNPLGLLYVYYGDPTATFRH